MLRTQVRFAVMALLIQLGMASNYTVGGGPNGWDTSGNPQAWASAQTFVVGDNLIFQFTPNHDVLEVSKADHDSCSTSNPIQTHSSSPVVITLSSAGQRCFICGTAGHCGQGMKIEVDTLASSSPPSASPAPPPTSLPASPVTPPSTSPPPQISPSSPASPATPPTSSPPPETSPPPKSAPSSPSTPTSSPAPSSNGPSVESPSSSPPPSPSSAHKDSFQASLVMGFGFIMTNLLAL